jgi:hypothetical protein
MAAVAGPGQFSRRTDKQPVRQLTDAAYGEQATFRADQQGAPMVASANQAQPMPVDPAAGVTPLNAPSARPDEPVTAGADVGAGPGTEVLGLPTPAGEAKALLQYLPMLERRANSAESSQTLRNIVQYLKGLG